MHQERQDSAFYSTIIEHLVDDFPWMSPDGEVSPSAVAAEASDPTGVAELQLKHIYTDAELYCQLPAPGDGAAARVVLYQGLDNAIESSQSRGDGFVDALATAHQTIADVYASGYVTPVADPTVVLEATVPHRYTDAKLYSMMTAITATALRVQRLHEELRATVGAVTDAEPDGGRALPRPPHESSVRSARQR